MGELDSDIETENVFGSVRTAPADGALAERSLSGVPDATAQGSDGVRAGVQRRMPREALYSRVLTIHAPTTASVWTNHVELAASDQRYCEIAV